MEGARAARDVVDEQHGDENGEHCDDVQPPETDVPCVPLAARQHHQAETESNAGREDMDRYKVYGPPIAGVTQRPTRWTLRRAGPRVMLPRSRDHPAANATADPLPDPAGAQPGS